MLQGYPYLRGEGVSARDTLLRISSTYFLSDIVIGGLIMRVSPLKPHVIDTVCRWAHRGPQTDCRVQTKYWIWAAGPRFRRRMRIPSWCSGWWEVRRRLPWWRLSARSRYRRGVIPKIPTGTWCGVCKRKFSLFTPHSVSRVPTWSYPFWKFGIIYAKRHLRQLEQLHLRHLEQHGFRLVQKWTVYVDEPAETRIPVLGHVRFTPLRTPDVVPRKRGPAAHIQFLVWTLQSVWGPRCAQRHAQCLSHEISGEKRAPSGPLLGCQIQKMYWTNGEESLAHEPLRYGYPSSISGVWVRWDERGKAKR